VRGLFGFPSSTARSSVEDIGDGVSLEVFLGDIYANYMVIELHDYAPFLEAEGASQWQVELRVLV